MQRDQASSSKTDREKVSQDEAVKSRMERRQMIKSAIAAMPVVMTITAGTARAQGGDSLTYESAELQNDLEGDGNLEVDPNAGLLDELSPEDQQLLHGDGLDDNPVLPNF